MNKLTRYQSFEELKSDSEATKFDRKQSNEQYAELEHFLTALRTEFLAKQPVPVATIKKETH